MKARLVEKIRRMLRIRYKALRQSVRTRPDHQVVAFVVGCQRSGTTMLSRIFERDLNARVYGERSSLTSQDSTHHIRLNDLDSVRQIVQQNRAPLVVVKPLVESQRTGELLSSFPGSKAIWIYRHYRAVALSNRNRFGAETAISDIRPMMGGDSGNWRSDSVNSNVLSLIKSHFSEAMNPSDAAVLFWCARNELFFDLALNESENVLLVRYENLVTKPGEVTREIYQRLGRPYDDRYVSGVHADSVGRGQDIELSEAVEWYASKLMQRLDKEHNQKYIRQTGVID